MLWTLNQTCLTNGILLSWETNGTTARDSEICVNHFCCCSGRVGLDLRTWIQKRLLSGVWSRAKTRGSLAIWHRQCCTRLDGSLGKNLSECFDEADCGSLARELVHSSAVKPHQVRNNVNTMKSCWLHPSYWFQQLSVRSERGWNGYAWPLPLHSAVWCEAHQDESC